MNTLPRFIAFGFGSNNPYKFKDDPRLAPPSGIATTSRRWSEAWK